MLVDGCSSGIPQCAGIHWRTTLCVGMCCRVIAFVLLGGETCLFWRTSNTDNASVRKTVGEHGSKESLTKFAACLSASGTAL